MQTNFGYKKVNEQEKQNMVNTVFSSVASKYDIMNDLMSLGTHRLWKDYFVKLMRPQEQDYLLDLAGGTGDISFRFLQQGGKKATICDINHKMMLKGKERAIDENIAISTDKLNFVCANAEKLPFKDNSVPLISIAFGIRNVTNIQNVLNEAQRVLKVGGRFMCLEFSNVDNALIKKIYDLYSFKLIPKIGKFITNDEDSYQYLVESIRQFPTAMNFIKMMDKSGLRQNNVRKLSGGIVAIHSGYKV